MGALSRLLMDGGSAQTWHRSKSGASRHRAQRPRLREATNPAGPTRRGTAFIGDDDEGLPVEVVGVLLADGRLRVIHAMEMRSGYRPLYEEAKRWRV